jgi:hypothetical protein
MTREEWSQKIYAWFKRHGGYVNRDPAPESWDVCLDNTWDFKDLAKYILKLISEEKGGDVKHTIDNNQTHLRG